MKCLNCNTYTTNPKFCSRVCAATKNNKLFPKRKLENVCKTCDVAISSKYTYCKNCWSRKSIKFKTLDELKLGNANQYGYPTIRADSRKSYIKSGRPMECFICGYSYHVDIAHIKDIKDFDGSTLVYEINDLGNLVALCRNHHYEFDCGDLNI